MAARDGILPYIGGIFCTLQNTTMAEKNDFENIYDIVNSGRWTADKMYDMTKGVYVDLNGNTEADKEDIYGIELSNYNNSIPFMASCEANVFTKTDSGYESPLAVSAVLTHIMKRLENMPRVTFGGRGAFFRKQP